MSRRVLLLAVLLSGSVLCFAWMYGPFRWRFGLVANKIQGYLPEATWKDVFSPMVRRFPQAQVASSNGAPPCPTLWKTPLGLFWGRSTDGQNLTGVVREELVDIYQRGSVEVRSGDVVLDVGAHLGTFTRVALDRGASRVLAVEPNPVSAACFERTFQQEISTGRVILVNAAVCDTPGILPFTGEGVGFRRVRGGPVTAAHWVPATTIDDIARSLNLPRLDFIKMDIEGSERDALAGARRTLSRFAPRMSICVYHRPDDPVVVPQRVRAARDAYRWFTDYRREQFYFY